MKTVWKFLLNAEGWNDVAVGGEVTQAVLTAPDPLTGYPAVWIAHDPEGKPMVLSFYVVGTGNPIPDDDADQPIEHVGSMIAGEYVWHVFERTLYHGEAS